MRSEERSGVDLAYWVRWIHSGPDLRARLWLSERGGAVGVDEVAAGGGAGPQPGACGESLIAPAGLAGHAGG